jgi:hypothetical protein
VSLTDDDPLRADLSALAKAFIDAACQLLRSERVVPPPMSRRFIRVGRDYYGVPVMELPEFKALERHVEERYPRFDPDLPLMDRDFTNGYLLSFLEACVALAVTNDGSFRPSSGPGFQRSLDELAKQLSSSSFRVAACREVFHLTTDTEEPVDLLDMKVIPVNAEPADHRRTAHEIITSVLPAASSAYNGEEPGGWAPPHAVIVATDIGPKPFELANEISDRIERLLLLLRLLHSGTCVSMYEVQGEPAVVCRFHPTLVRFRGQQQSIMGLSPLIRRTTRVSANDDERVRGLWDLLSTAETPREGMLFTSLGIAIHRFQLSYHSHAWHESLLDLATAFEATLSGRSPSDVTLRLRTRAAALLASDEDPATAIFNDVGHLYGLRSRLVHGDDMRQKDLKRIVDNISTVPDGQGFGVQIAHTVDRLRDLVRRSILARVCLAAGTDSVWPMGKDDDVDAKLSDDQTRREWRSAWRQSLADIGAEAAADRPTDARWLDSDD